MYNGTNPYRTFFDPDYIRFTEEMFKAAAPKFALENDGKVIIVGTAGDLDKHALSKFSALWHQRLMSADEVKKEYGK